MEYGDFLGNFPLDIESCPFSSSVGASSGPFLFLVKTRNPRHHAFPEFHFPPICTLYSSSCSSERRTLGKRSQFLCGFGESDCPPRSPEQHWPQMAQWFLEQVPVSSWQVQARPRPIQTVSCFKSQCWWQRLNWTKISPHGLGIRHSL